MFCIKFRNDLLFESPHCFILWLGKEQLGESVKIASWSVAVSEIGESREIRKERCRGGGRVIYGSTRVKKGKIPLIYFGSSFSFRGSLILFFFGWLRTHTMAEKAF